MSYRMLQPRGKKIYREEKRGNDRTMKKKEQCLGSLRMGRELLRKKALKKSNTR